MTKLNAGTPVNLIAVVTGGLEGASDELNAAIKHLVETAPIIYGLYSDLHYDQAKKSVGRRMPSPSLAWSVPNDRVVYNVLANWLAGQFVSRTDRDVVEPKGISVMFIEPDRLLRYPVAVWNCSNLTFESVSYPDSRRDVDISEQERETSISFALDSCSGTEEDIAKAQSILDELNKLSPNPYAGDIRYLPGDKVRLNSGGPQMTVSEFDEEGNLVCTWKGSSKWEVSDFPSACVTPCPLQKEQQ